MVKKIDKGINKQYEMPFAVVEGEPVTELPQDLYIPPFALKVFLEAFEGPLDLLLYLIKRQNLNILDIPVTEITQQYIDYINLMEEIKLELAGEYLLMAAMLAEIKSRMLLPRPEVEEDEEDPRAELVRRLQEYERFKMAAEDLDAIPRLERDIVIANVEAPEKSVVIKLPDVTLKELLIAFHDVLKRVEMNSELHFEKETLSVKQRMLEIINRIQVKKFIDFVDLFSISEGRLGIAVTFLAVLELLKDATIEVVQNEEFAPMHIRVSSAIHITED
ncbi:MAG: segregation/condensation protein A [Woeseiaceae bacterium]|jgi:segregation and condensation protein A|nr:segregation/condensation protein A [Woeseiaceae bacterium]MDG1016798.1 segregation/condensation protein A [Woeseiaceae bacterium]MDG1865652.1 segregation/condensation protein A [Woeseiaceae bacterium]